MSPEGKPADAGNQGWAQGVRGHGKAAWLVLAAAMAAYVAFTCAMAIRDHRRFADVCDTYFFVNVFWNTCHGQFLYTGETGVNSLGDHFWPTLLLVAPAYALCQSAVTLIIAQRLALALAAVPLYLCASRALNHSRAGLLIALAYLLYPPHLSIDLQGFKDISIAVPMLMWMLACFETRRLRWLWLALVFSCGVKENVPLVVGCFGVFVACCRRRWRLGGSIAGAAGVWFLLVILVIFPHFARMSFDARYMDRNFAFMGETSMSGIIVGILTNPLEFLRLFLARSNLAHLARLLGPVCFTPLAAPEILIMAVPVVVQNLLMQSTIAHDTLTHHHAAMVPAIFYAAAVGIGRISALAARRGIDGRRLVPWLAGATLVCSAVWLPLSPQARILATDTWESPFDVPMMQDDRIAVAERLMAMIPPDASVTCSRNLGNRLAARPVVWTKLRNLTAPQAQMTEWCMLDLAAGAVEGYSRPHKLLRQIEAYLANHECVAREAGFVLLRRRPDAIAEPFKFTADDAHTFWLASWQRAQGIHKAHPSRPDALVAAALLLMESRLFHEAAEVLTKGIDGIAPSPYPWVLLGTCHHALGDRRAARLAWSQALRIDPADEQVRDLLAGLDRDTP